jgi:hypothetical protein
MGISAAYKLRLDPDIVGEIKAPVHVNIEIDKAYINFVSIIANMNPGKIQIYSKIEKINRIMRPVILYSKITYGEDDTPFIYALFLRIPIESTSEVLDAIDNISIFIGNKMFYFSHADVVNLQGKEQGGYMVYELQGLEYKKSIIAALLKFPQWINWYGDFNLALKTVLAFITQPGRYIITWCFLICLLILCWPDIKNNYSALRKQKNPWAELLLLSFIVLTGFILRFNGYVRYSSGFDELYSACQASNPDLPFMNTFGDPGNPPLYFILLRFWFMLFGWTEQSGRLFSVIIGSAAIISLYIMVKRFSNKKAAFLAALYMATSAYFIDFSQEMRAYILEVFLVSIVTFRFFIIMQKGKLSLNNLIWYIIPSVLLVNTHYYGSLFIFAIFLFFVTYSIHTKTFTWKKTTVFFTGNIIIASSLLPYFIHTAFNKALFDSDFNTWIEKPGLVLMCIAVLVPLLGVLYLYLRKTVFQKTLPDSHRCFLDYSVFVAAVVYLIAFGISMYRPILIMKYLILFYPLLIAAASITLINVFTNSSKLIGGLCICLMFSWIVEGYEEKQGNWDVYHEALVYISKDAKAHFQNTSMEVLPKISGEHFYGYKELPLYVPGDNYDILYFNPLHHSEKEMYLEIDALGISQDRILRIHINDFQHVFKIYAGASP